LVGREISSIDLSSEPVDLARNDIILLASDGLLTLPESRVTQVMASERHQDLSIIGENLITAVTGENRRNQDNCTILLFAPARLLTPRMKWFFSLLLGIFLAAGIVFLLL
jgi:hypothetical protein